MVRQFSNTVVEIPNSQPVRKERSCLKIGFIDFVFSENGKVGSDGLSEVIWNLATPLAVAGHEVHIVAPYKKGPYPSNLVHVHPFDLPFWGYRNILGHILIVQRAIKLIKQLGPFDILHAPEYLSTALLGLAQLHTPIVLTEPGNIYDRVANGNPYDFVTTQVYKVAARISARACDTIIATSEEMGYWWAKTGTLPKKIKRIPLGVNLTSFSPISGAKHQLGWDPQQKHLLFVARLSVETGAQYLLQALPQILDFFPKAHLHILGSGNFEPVLHQLETELALQDHLTWHGWIPLKDLGLYYSAADAMIFPGTSGGTPRVMLQAMACGTPFIGSAIGGIVDHVIPGRTGWLVPQRDPTALAETLVEVLSNPAQAQARAEKACQYVQELSWANIANRTYQEVYRPLALKKSIIN